MESRFSAVSLSFQLVFQCCSTWMSHAEIEWQRNVHKYHVVKNNRSFFVTKLRARIATSLKWMNYEGNLHSPSNSFYLNRLLLCLLSVLICFHHLWMIYNPDFTFNDTFVYFITSIQVLSNLIRQWIPNQTLHKYIFGAYEHIKQLKGSQTNSVSFQPVYRCSHRSLDGALKALNCMMMHISLAHQPHVISSTNIIADGKNTWLTLINRDSIVKSKSVARKFVNIFVNQQSLLWLGTQEEH